MDKESLEDHLRRATRNFTTRLPEERAVALAAELARELVRAHAETPPRHPDLDPAAVTVADGHPRLDGSASRHDVAEDLFHLGGLLYFMATGERPNVAWRLDGPPAGALSTLARQAALAALSAPRTADRFASAAEAASALEAAVTPGPIGTAPWPMFRGDSSRRGARPAPSAARSLAPAWEVRIGAVTASPVLGPSLAIAPTADGRLVFVDRASGRRVHEMRLASAIESSPALVERVLHVGSDDGEVIGVDVVDGAERYRTKLGRLVRSSPVPWEDRVVVGVVEEKTAGGVAALDAAKGKLVWMRKAGAVFSSPALAGAMVLVGSDDGSVYALDAGKGTVLWAERLGGKVRATPAMTEDVAIAADFDGRVVALRVKDGTRAWTTELGHAVYSSPCLAGELCVLGCHEGHIHGLDVRKGTPRFQAQTRGPVVASAAAAGDRLLIASTDGTLYLLDAEGRVLHQVPLSSQGVQSSLALGEDGGTVVVGSGEGLHGLRLMP
jgi:outer membrane protein assembly factor BamB